MKAFLFLPFLLAACVEGSEPAGPGEIRLVTGGGFGGDLVTTIRSDDIYSMSSGGGLLNEPSQSSDSALAAGTYASARALLERKLPALAARVGDELCEPHADGRSIWVSPPIRGIDGVSECSAGEVTVLIREVEALVRSNPPAK